MLPRTCFRALLFVLTLLASSAVLAFQADAESKRRSHHNSHHGSDHDRVRGSGVLETRTLDLQNFEKVRIDGVADMVIHAGKSFSVQLTAEDNVIDLVDVQVRRGELIVEENDFNFDTDEGVQLTIEMPVLAAIRIDGVGNIEVFDLENEELRVDVDGVGNISVEGTTERLDVQVDGVGEVMLGDLVAQDVDVSLDGVGDVTIHVERTLRANVDGMGSLKYYGDPEIVRESVDGFGRIIGLDS
jgi:hypothetical protein